MKNQIKISEMTGKMKDIRAICTNTKTNPFCQAMQKTDAICKDCYSQRMLEGIRRNCEPAWERNSVLFSQGLIPIEDLPILKKDKVFRLHAHGELINEIHVQNFMNLVKKNPQTMFGWFTKRKDLMNPVLAGKPDNLIMIYSNPKIDDPNPVLPAGFDKIFSVYTKDTGNINCAKSCAGCMFCYSHNKIEYVNELIK